HFEALLLAALRRAGAVWISKAAVVDAEIGVLNRSVLRRLGAKRAALEQAAAAHVLRAESHVHPGQRRKIIGIAEDEAFAGALADVGNHKTGLADFCAGWGGGVRKPNQGNAK